MPSSCFLPMVRRSATVEWELLHQPRSGKTVYATPALVAGRIYLGTGPDPRTGAARGGGIDFGHAQIE